MQGCHPCHVDPVDVNVQTGPPQHADDRLPVRLLDAFLKHNFIWEPHSSYAGVCASKEACSPRHPQISLSLKSEIHLIKTKFSKEFQKANGILELYIENTPCIL